MAKKGEQKEIKVNDKEYTLQHPGNMWILNTNDQCKNNYGVVMESKMVKSIFEHVVVKPKVDIDDLEFADIKEILEEAKCFLGIDG